MSTSAAPLDSTSMLRPERDALLELLRTLSSDDWERPTECPAWNVKGLALHILGDDLSLLTRQRDASTDSLTLFAADHPGMDFRSLLDGFNEQWVTASQFLSTDLVIELLRLVGDWSEAFYREVGLETVSSEPVGLFAETNPSPYWQVISREYLERFVHQSQIRRAVRASELSGEIVTWAATVIVHILAAWMADYAPATGATIAIDYGPPVGTWSWERTANRWVVREGGTGGEAARVTIAPTATVAFLSRGMSPKDAAAALTVSGDEALARGAIDVVAPLLGAPPA
jgi:uncharacterized protein (TIGR03083 family)